MTTLGEALIGLLEAHGVDTVFGIPGVHTVELYRGLARSAIRHVTPRHEQGAAFMADGYARACGKPGVAFLITGPGVTNAITPMAQARADSIPMLVISAVNRSDTLGKGLGYLHELPDQRGVMEKIALFSQRVTEPAELPQALARAFTVFASGRPGPVHIEIPLDAMRKPAGGLSAIPVTARPPKPDKRSIAQAAGLASAAAAPLIIAGGGARSAAAPLRALAEKLDAPVVLTINGRGLMHGHPLVVPASPSLEAVRRLMAESDFTIGVGTEFGPTDFDLYATGRLEMPRNLVRIDIDAEQLKRRPAAVSIQADSGEALTALGAALANKTAADGAEAAPSTAFGGPPPPLRRGGAEVAAVADTNPPPPELVEGTGEGDRAKRGGGGAAAAGRNEGAARAEATRAATLQELSADMRGQVRMLEAIRDTLPGALIVGDSTQPVYAGNLYYDHDRPGRWFNSSCGYGALGYGPPAAIGAALAAPDAPVVCLVGDGGFQFTLPEIGVALETGAVVIFVVWNNRGYREIETSMLDAGVEPVGVSPAPPDFLKIADAYGMAAERIDDIAELPAALGRARGKASLIEIIVP